MRDPKIDSSIYYELENGWEALLPNQVKNYFATFTNLPDHVPESEETPIA